MNFGKVVAIAAALLVVLGIGAFAMYMVDIDQTQEARLPEVEVQGGQAPEFDADVGSVEMKDEKVDVAVPKVKVEEETVEVPTLEMNPPRQDNPADNPTSADGKTDKEDISG